LLVWNDRTRHTRIQWYAGNSNSDCDSWENNYCPAELYLGKWRCDIGQGTFIEKIVFRFVFCSRQTSMFRQNAIITVKNLPKRKSKESREFQVHSDTHSAVIILHVYNNCLRDCIPISRDRLEFNQCNQTFYRSSGQNII